jgi:hypothetical protein
MTTDNSLRRPNTKTDQAGRAAAQASPPRARKGAKPLLAPAGNITLIDEYQRGGRKLTKAERFERHVCRHTTPYGCDVWTGSVMQANGYPQFWDLSPITGKPTMRKAHRVAYELHHGKPNCTMASPLRAIGL